jgi:hypothetical protein
MNGADRTGPDHAPLEYAPQRRTRGAKCDTPTSFGRVRIRTSRTYLEVRMPLQSGPTVSL